jgi:hypothetical protein
MKREAGWCRHVRGYGFLRSGGSSGLCIECEHPLVIYWPSESVMVIACMPCYKRENPTGAPPGPLLVREPGASIQSTA